MDQDENKHFAAGTDIEVFKNGNGTYSVFLEDDEKDVFFTVTKELAVKLKEDLILSILGDEVCPSTHGGAGWALGSYREGDEMVCGLCGGRFQLRGVSSSGPRNALESGQSSLFKGQSFKTRIILSRIWARIASVRWIRALRERISARREP